MGPQARERIELLRFLEKSYLKLSSSLRFGLKMEIDDPEFALCRKLGNLSLDFDRMVEESYYCTNDDVIFQLYGDDFANREMMMLNLYSNQVKQYLDNAGEKRISGFNYDEYIGTLTEEQPVSQKEVEQFSNT